MFIAFSCLLLFVVFFLINGDTMWYYIAACMAVWLSGNVVGRINEVTLRRAGLVLGWVTVRGYTVLALNQATQANSAFHHSGVGKSSSSLL